MRAMTICAIACGAGVRHFGRVDLLGLIVMAGQAKSFGVGLCEDHLSLFGRRMAKFASFICERWMHKLNHQLWGVRLMGVVALQAICCGERLILMRLLQTGVLRIVTIQAKCWSGLGEMEQVLLRRFGAGLVGDMAGVAAHIEGRMSAALLRYVQSSLVAI